MPASTPYDSTMLDIASGNIVLSTDTFYALLVSGYTPDPTNHSKRSDITGEVSGTGYTAGGQALSGISVATTQANSWAVTRANSTAYAVETVVRPATGNGYLYRAVVAGTTAGTLPTYPTVVGTTVVDGGVTWVNIGTSANVVTATNPAWASSTISATGLVVCKHRGGAASADNLVSYVDFGGTVTSTAATFTATSLATTGFLTINKS